MGTDNGDKPDNPEEPIPRAVAVHGAEADAKAEAKDDGALDREPAIATEPGPAAPVAAEVADEVASEPPLRQSMAQIGDDQPLAFPDDGDLAKRLRKADHVAGTVEQAVLFALLAVVVIAGASAGIADKLGKTLPSTDYIVRTGVLAIALIGAAFASHQQRHLAMDLVSRRLKPRGRLILRLFLGAVTIFVVGILMTSFWRDFKQLSGEHNANNPLPPWLAPSTLPIGGGLVIFHTLLHLIIDVDYLVRGKLPPERARSAH